MWVNLPDCLCQHISTFHWLLEQGFAPERGIVVMIIICLYTGLQLQGSFCSHSPDLWPRDRDRLTLCSPLPLWCLSDATDTDCFDINTGSLFATDCSKIEISPCWLAVSSCHKISAFSGFCVEDVMDKNVKIEGFCCFYSFCLGNKS